ncbi:MAG: thioredoxin-dependent thiol peroxidase [Bacteroidota bacterium]|nr:thioredoxin-dependent thiol peroxidase [Bacteroidota bacterium]
MALRVGQSAPEFTALDQEGNTISLADYRGKWVVLYFYPRDNTSGCTREACEFRDALEQISAHGAVVIGVSPDSVRSHQNFAQKHQLPFRLLADEHHRIAEAYEVWKEKKLYGKTYYGVERTTYIIAPDGTIAAVFSKVRPDGHALQVVQTLAQLRSQQ